MIIPDSKRDVTIRLFEMIVETKGNPSVQDFMSIGYPRKTAENMIMRMCNTSREKMVSYAEDVLSFLRK